MAPLRGIVVSHTHWDRAWYLPFQTFRHRLVLLIDRLIGLLDSRPDFRSFTLDGQTVLLEDYLALRPEREVDLTRLIGEDRLLIGPWYTAPDLFLASGEALIRNLQRGRQISERMGGTMPVGYVPDPFGHIAQMPQILRGFGIDNYLFTRGMSARMKRELGGIFEWEAPSGDAVRAVYLRDGYFNASALGHPDIFGRYDGRQADFEMATKRVLESLDNLRALQPADTFLFLNGMDHMPEQADLPEILGAINLAQDRIHLEHGTLPDYVEAIASEIGDRPTFSGDMLGNEDHPILFSVHSTRTYLKQQNHHAQWLLTRIAEPLAAWTERTLGDTGAAAFLDEAWRLLLLNHPHDDICGCSVDAVHDEDETRFGEVRQIGEALVTSCLEMMLERGLEPVAARTDAAASDVFVFNPHPYALRYRLHTSILFPEDAVAGSALETLRGVDSRGREVRVHVERVEEPVMRVAYLEQTWGRRYHISAEVDLPALGFTILRVFEEPLADPGEAILPSDQVRMDGGRLDIQVNGRLIRDAIRFEYVRDAGDTYSFSPVENDRPRYARLISVQPSDSDTRNVTAHFAMEAPAALGSEDTVEIPITVEIEEAPDGHFDLRVRYENTARNGRLRILLASPFRIDACIAGATFRQARRGRTDAVLPEEAPERYAAYPGELVYTTRHHEHYVVAEGTQEHFWVADRGLPEYEIVETAEGSAVAITLHRAVGHLSVTGGRLRRCGAGPHLPTPGAQCQRAMEAHIAFGLSTDGLQHAVTRARSFALPPFVREMPFLPYLSGEGTVPRQLSFVESDNEAIEVVSLRRNGEAVIARLCNPTSEVQRARIRLRGWKVSSCAEIGLDDNWTAAEPGPTSPDGLTVEIPPFKLKTYALL
jgi:mannosylglycerate hydrolase